jgi:putative peptide zinc metalloprotease protein
MATLADSLLSSTTRPLPVRKRPDLVARRQRYQGQDCWVVKDPVGLNYFQFQDEEYAILQMLDGQTSLEEIRDRFEAEFPPRKLPLEEIYRFLGMLHQSGLVLSTLPGQGDQLYERRGERRRQKLLAAMTNLLAFRFRGLDPERLLTRLYPYFRWFFSPVTVVLCLAMAVGALVLVGVQFDRFLAKLPEFNQFFGLRNAFLLAIALGATKVLHEFGHGLSCKHFGGECHELGFMLLVLTPCLYCDVSDSWLLPSKWRRAAIAAAGIYVEIVLASIATFVWWSTEPGVLHYLALNVMLIGSVSTILFNGNPLLRYDGYYILSDLLEIPNLRQKASSLCNRKLGEWFLGIEPPEDVYVPRRHQVLFVVYSIATVIYRWVIVFAILFFLYKVFEPVGLKILGQAMVACSLAGMVGMPIYKLVRFFHVPGHLEKVKRHRLGLVAGGLALLVAGFFLVKLPHHVVCTFEVQPRKAASIYVTVPGKLAAIDVEPGQHVAHDQVLARLEDLDLDLAIAELEGLESQCRTRLESLAWQRHRDERAAMELHEVKKTLEGVTEQLDQRRKEKNQLVLVAPRQGTVMPPSWTADQQHEDGRLPGWSGIPLDRQNLACLLERGVPFCQIGDPRSMEAILVIDQADVDLVNHGQTVKLLLDEMPFRKLAENPSDVGHAPLQIAEISSTDLKIASKQLSTKAGGELPTKTDASGMERPMSPSYQARVPLDNDGGLLRPGLRGTAKIRTENLSLATSAWRAVMRTINFRL